MDGNRTKDFIGSNEKVEQEDCYSFIRKYNPDSTEKFGQELIVNFDNTIVSSQVEYLVFFDVFRAKLEDQGFEFISTGIFTPDRDLGYHGNLIAPLFRKFAFKRIRTTKELKDLQIKVDRQVQAKQEKKNTLRMIPTIDKSLKFDQSFAPGNPLVRTGSVADGSCLLHSLLKSYKEEYSSFTTEKERQTFMKQYRILLSEHLTLNMWKKLSNGNLAASTFINKLPSYIEDPDSNPMIKKIDYESLPNLQFHNIDEIKQYIINNAAMKPRMSKLLNAFELSIFKDFQKAVSDCSVWVGQSLDDEAIEIFEYVSDICNIDIYIIRDATRQPYRSGEDCTLRYKHRKSVIILWVGGNHYEPIGRIFEDGSIQRLFDPDDPLIVIIRDIVCK